MSKQSSVISVLGESQLIIIKVGSVLVRGADLDEVNASWMESLARDIASLKAQGKKIVLVSSGGVALGRKALNISADVAPNAIPLAKKQAASAVGQYHLFNGYFQAFKKNGLMAAQVLLTMSETENRRMNLNARETLYTLLEDDIIPIINENDTVSTGEIRFGDNDRLAVRVAQMVMADCVILLSTADGLCTDNPQNNPQAKHIPVIEAITQDHIDMAGDAVAGLSTGGMKSKIEAAQSAVKAGIHLIMTEGRDNGALSDLCQQEDKLSSIFLAQKTNANARKVWLASHMSPRGVAIIDEGALNALKNGKSLLPIGVKAVEGTFLRGDVIEIKTQDGQRVGMGLSAYKSDDAMRIIGKQSGEIGKILGYLGRNELIHRNDMVLEA
ncbi:MAG: glutamate 5-kinase [Alphaproteobacteria bacterium]